MERLTKALFEKYVNRRIDWMEQKGRTKCSVFFPTDCTSLAELQQFAMPYKTHNYYVEILNRQDCYEVYITY